MGTFRDPSETRTNSKETRYRAHRAQRPASVDLPARSRRIGRTDRCTPLSNREPGSQGTGRWRGAERLLEKGQATPVATGDVLYEIGPLEELRIEIEVPAIDVANIAAGQSVKIWINGFERSRSSPKSSSFSPRSELRHDQNVFIAKVAVENRDLNRCGRACVDRCESPAHVVHCLGTCSTSPGSTPSLD